MAKTKKPAEEPKKRSASETNPNTEAVLVRMSKDTRDALDAWVEELNDTALASGDPRQWNRTDVLRAIILRRVRDRAPGEQP